MFVVSQNNYQHDRNAIDKCFPIRGNKNPLLFQIVQRYFWIKFNSTVGLFTKINFWTNTYQIQNEFFKRAIIQQAIWHHLDTCILKLQLSMQHSAMNCKINQIMKLSQGHCSLQQLLRACHLLPYFAQIGFSLAFTSPDPCSVIYVYNDRFHKAFVQFHTNTI